MVMLVAQKVFPDYARVYCRVDSIVTMFSLRNGYALAEIQQIL